MDRLQELEILIKDQTEKVKALLEPYQAKLAEVSKEFQNRVNAIIQPVASNASCDFCMHASGDGYGYCNLLDSEGEKIFGASIDLYYNHHFDGPYELEVNVGTCGSFSKDNIDQINKYKILAAVLDNLAPLEAYLLSNREELYDLAKAHFDADNELDRLEWEKEKILEDAKYAEADSTIKVGNLYKIKGYHTDFKGRDYAKVLEVSGKRILFQVGWLENVVFTETQKCPCFHISDTCWYNKRDFLTKILRNDVEQITEFTE